MKNKELVLHLLNDLCHSMEHELLDKAKQEIEEEKYYITHNWDQFFAQNNKKLHVPAVIRLVSAHNEFSTFIPIMEQINEKIKDSYKEFIQPVNELVTRYLESRVSHLEKTLFDMADGVSKRFEEHTQLLLQENCTDEECKAFFTKLHEIEIIIYTYYVKPQPRFTDLIEFILRTTTLSQWGIYMGTTSIVRIAEIIKTPFLNELFLYYDSRITEQITIHINQLREKIERIIGEFQDE